MSSFACSAIFIILFLVAAVLPVVMMSISISPVVGSVAACCVAIFIRVMAYSTSLTITSLESRILAKASLSRIRDSSCRGVAVIIFLLFPRCLISE